jgi:pimeloyl-ACP methyl ester carboxylesterase
VATADLYAALMRDVLGYDRFLTEGGDWGALVCAQLGHKYADRLIGLFTHLPAAPNAMLGNMPRPEDFTAEEQPWIEENKRYYREELGYFEQQSSKPFTLALALNDSPIGLAAWLVEKRHSWSGCRGDLESVFSKDELLTNVMLYWLTQSAGSAAQYYRSVRHQIWQPSHDGMPMMNVPTGVAVFADEIAKLPRAYVARNYDLRRWTVLPRAAISRRPNSRKRWCAKSAPSRASSADTAEGPPAAVIESQQAGAIGGGLGEHPQKRPGQHAIKRRKTSPYAGRAGGLALAPGRAPGRRRRHRRIAGHQPQLGRPGGGLLSRLPADRADAHRAPAGI